MLRSLRFFKHAVELDVERFSPVRPACLVSVAGILDDAVSIQPGAIAQTRCKHVPADADRLQ